MPRGDMDPARGELAVSLFDWTQRAADIWRGSNNAVRREILDAVCLNRTLSDVNLVTTKRKPFDVFAKGLDLKNSRDDKTAIELFRRGVTTISVQLPIAAQGLVSLLSWLSSNEPIAK